MTIFPLRPFRVVNIKLMAYHRLGLGLGHTQASNRNTRGQESLSAPSAWRSDWNLEVLKQVCQWPTLSNRQEHIYCASTSFLNAFLNENAMWSFNIKALAPIESSKMYRLEVLQVEREARKQERKKQVDARRHDRKDKTQTPKKKERRGKKNNPQRD